MDGIFPYDHDNGYNLQWPGITEIVHADEIDINRIMTSSLASSVCLSRLLRIGGSRKNVLNPQSQKTGS